MEMKNFAPQNLIPNVNPFDVRNHGQKRNLVLKKKQRETICLQTSRATFKLVKVFLNPKRSLRVCMRVVSLFGC